jgi:hypothetical protein
VDFPINSSETTLLAVTPAGFAGAFDAIYFPTTDCSGTGYAFNHFYGLRPRVAILNGTATASPTLWVTDAVRQQQSVIALSYLPSDSGVCAPTPPPFNTTPQPGEVVTLIRSLSTFTPPFQLAP